jgi:hypothetical protein
MHSPHRWDSVSIISDSWDLALLFAPLVYIAILGRRDGQLSASSHSSSLSRKWRKPSPTSAGGGHRPYARQQQPSLSCLPVGRI